MARKLKIIPVGSENLSPNGNVWHREIFDVISPVSWEFNTNTNNILEQGILGNSIVRSLPMQERTYTLNWLGSRKDINRIINYLTKTSFKHFLFGNLSDQNIITPGIMFNSKGMLASVADFRKLPGATYQDYLTHYQGSGYNVGSAGIRIHATANEFSFVDSVSSGVEAFMFIPPNEDYTMRINPVGYGYTDSVLNSLNFYATFYNIDDESSINEKPRYVEIDLTRRSDSYTINRATRPRILRLQLRSPKVTNATAAIRGVLNYIPPIIYRYGTTHVMDDYEDIPSVLRPVDDFVYNIISPNVAELSMNFKEVTHVSE